MVKMLMFHRVSLRHYRLQPARLLCPWNFPGKNTGVGCHFLLQGKSSNPGIKSMSVASPELAGRFFITSTTWEPYKTEPHKYFPYFLHNISENKLRQFFVLVISSLFFHNRLLIWARSLLIRQQFIYHGSLYPVSLHLSLACMNAQLCLTPCDPIDFVTHQAPLSIGFSRHEYWSGLPFPTLGDHSDPGIQPASLSPPVLTGRFFTTVPLNR